MTSQFDLVRAIIAPLSLEDNEVSDLLSEALRREVDPLRFIAHRFGLTDKQVMKRAARHCRLAYAPEVPPDQVDGDNTIPLLRLDGLHACNSHRARLFDRDVIYVAPDFFQMIRLARHLSAHGPLQRRTCVVPGSALRTRLAATHKAQLVDHARQHLTRHWPHANAHLELTQGYRLGFVLVLLILCAATVLAPHAFQPFLIPFLIMVLLVPAWFRFTVIFLDNPAMRTSPPGLPDDELPVYTVLIPLRSEAHMVGQLAAAMLALDYPAEKLDIKFVVEQDSPRTIKAVQAFLHYPQFELVAVPTARPFTKPKALNYALPLARGDLLVVYDAEDVPEPGQLRMAAEKFAEHPDLSCLQAELTPENASENWLAALFAAEYSGLFGLILPGLASWDLPIPLGGTSNHLRVTDLRELGGWDAFNVTEDADLGIRLARRGLKTGVLATKTFEEAPLTLSAWIGQRTRWMKGWMQTFLVHNRHPQKFIADIGLRKWLAIEIYVGGLIICPLLHTLYLVSLSVHIALSGVDPFSGAGLWNWFQIFIFAAGYLSAMAVSLAGALRYPEQIPPMSQLLLPIYWALMGWATGRALVELILRPHFWSKTSHGRTRIRRTVGSGTMDGPQPRPSRDPWSIALEEE